MGVALPLGLALGLALGDDWTAEVGLRAEARGEALASTATAPTSRGAASATPSASVAADLDALRLTTRYAPRFWTSDVAARPEPTVEHAAGVVLERRQASPWRGELGVDGWRGWTDPLLDPFRAAQTGETSLATARSIAWERVAGHGAAGIDLDLRTSLGAVGRWSTSRSVDAADRRLLPARSEALAEGSLTRLLGPRDSLRGGLTVVAVTTWGASGAVSDLIVGTSGAWRRRLTPTWEGWGTLGAAVAREESPRSPTRAGLYPTAEAGFARHGAGLSVDVEVSTRLAPMVDRLDGAVHAATETALTLRWLAARGVSVRATGTALLRTDARSGIGALDVRAVWAARDRLNVEAGVVGRGQLDPRPQYPTEGRAAVVLAMTWGSGPF